MSVYKTNLNAVNAAIGAAQGPVVASGRVEYSKHVAESGTTAEDDGVMIRTDMLDKEITRLGDTIQLLEERLDPFLFPAIAREDNDQPYSAQGCTLRNQLRDQLEHARFLTGKVTSLIDRLDR